MGRALRASFALLVVALLAGGCGEERRPEGINPLPSNETCRPGGRRLEIAAPPRASVSGFDKTCLAVRAGTPFEIEFHNRDPGVPHDVAIDRAPDLLFKGEIVTGQKTISYSVQGLEPGVYQFTCVVHPIQMKGALLVG